MQVLGLTVLAWGNSIGDMSTNMAMARKGLANMAMTACYAGPVFNLLASPHHHHHVLCTCDCQARMPIIIKYYLLDVA